MKAELDRGGGLSEVTSESVGAYDDNQRRLLAELYAIIAEAMPTEGRDFRVRIGFPEGGSNISVVLVGITDIGTAFARHVSSVLRAKGARNGSRAEQG